MKTSVRWVVLCAGIALALGVTCMAFAAGDAPKAASPEGKADTAVYITKGGKKYHTENCAQMNDEKTKITLGEAAVQGYTPCGSCKPPVLMVFVTKTGKAYHNGDCPSLKDSKTAMKFEDAVAQGYVPCKRCNPPAMPAAPTGEKTAPKTTEKKDKTK